MNIKTALPRLLPKAIAWAEEQQTDILATGFPLSQEQILIASKVGVSRPHNVKIKLVDKLPLPNDPELSEAAIHTGLLGPNMVGMTFFYGILICSHFIGNNELIAHECRHVQQYEHKGSIADFLTEYLTQIVDHGYANAPFELDARSSEIKYK